jgi:predicted DNA-binding WGR domain protein
MRRFEFVDSTSNKFWEVEVKGKTLNVTFGKIGTKGQSKPKDFATPEKAKGEMEKLIKEKTGKGYVEAGGKAIKAAKPTAKSAAKPAAKSIAGKNTNAGSVGEGLSKAEKQAKAEKVLLMFANGQWKLARGILEVAQDEHWLFQELLKGCKIKAGIPIPSVEIMDAFGEKETFEDYEFDEEWPRGVCITETNPVTSELLILEVLSHLPRELKELQKLRDKLGVNLGADILSKYWKEVAEGFEGVEFGAYRFRGNPNR